MYIYIYIYIYIKCLFQPELGWSVLESLGWNWNYRWAGPLALNVGLICKNKKQRGSVGARPLPKSIISGGREYQLLRE